MINNEKDNIKTDHNLSNPLTFADASRKHLNKNVEDNFIKENHMKILGHKFLDIKERVE
jgi:hypothetical protein